MKALFWALVLVNLLLAAYGWQQHDARRSAAADPRYQALNDHQVRLLSAQEVARLGPGKLAQLNLACAEWGPFSEGERQKAMKLIEPLNLGRTLSTRRVDVVAEHWVMIPPKANRAQADRAMAELRALKVEDAALITEDGPFKHAISLGLYRAKERAEARLEEVRRKGVKTATYQMRPQTLAMTALVLREPSQELLAKLNELARQMPASQVTTGACPEPR